MRLKNIFLILLGAAICLGLLKIYNVIKPRANYIWYEPDVKDRMKLVNLQDEISNQRKNAIVIAANKIGPAVVSITVIQTRIVTTQPFYSPFADDFFDEFFRDFFPPRRYKEKIQSLGSGVIITPDGYIVTNEHVVANATEIKVTLPDARQFDAKIIGADRTADVALLKIEGKDLPYATLGNSDDLIIGEWVIALGNPFAYLLEDTQPTVTVGVISALHRAIKSRGVGGREERIYKDLIQTDAAINPGNSGGPLVNILGEVVGLNTFIFSSSGGSEGVGFVLPINIVKHVTVELRAHGHRREPWHGLYLQNITDELAQALNIGKKGVLVSSVEDGSPATKVGLTAGDQIIEAQNKIVNRMADWEAIEAKLLVGDTLNLKIIKGGKEFSKKFIVEEYSQAVFEKRLSSLGIKVQNINMPLKTRFSLTRDNGVVVVDIKKGSLGERLGLRSGDIVLQWGNQLVANTNDFIRATRYAAKDVTIVIDRRGMLLEIVWRT